MPSERFGTDAPPLARSTETLPGGTVVFTSPRHRFGTDALLLARFAPMQKRWSACDLGSGCGVLLLSLLDRGLSGRAVGVERDEEGASLLQRAIEENGFANAQAHLGDLRGFKTPNPFDMVLCNPPYFTAGKTPPDAQRAAARHQLFATLGDVCAAASHILKDGGRFCICYPAGSLPRLFAELTAQSLAPKRMQLVRKTPGDAPWLALVEARKSGGEGLAIQPDHILEQPLAY